MVIVAEETHTPFDINKITTDDPFMVTATTTRPFADDEGFCVKCSDFESCAIGYTAFSSGTTDWKYNRLAVGITGTGEFWYNGNMREFEVEEDEDSGREGQLCLARMDRQN